ncbi:MAG TPA: glycosyltransferase family 4 protein [Geobacteraceae bacterium]|nr:glycosyltransferase family 4 protein [Geobacteraceae bacterium]
MAVDTKGNNDIPAEKRVIFVVDKSGFGGVQTIAYTLIEQDMDDRIEMIYFFLRNINSRFAMEDIQKPNVLYAKAVHRYSVSPFFELLRIIGEKKATVLHLNGNKSIMFGLVVKKLFRPEIKIIAHEHGGVFDYSQWFTAFLRFFRHNFDLFITISNYRKRFLIERCRVEPASIRVLDNFVDPARLTTTGVTANGRTVPDRKGKEETFVIGYVGGLSRIKGCDVLIRALPMLKGRMGDFRVVVAGDGPARAELEELVAGLGLRELVSFLGFVEKPGQAYIQFDIMTIPSRSEEGPICLYEAWTMGLPVVASDAPVLNERIRDGETGLLFRSGSPEDLAEKILLLYNDAGLSARIREGGLREAGCRTVAGFRSNLREIYLSL